MECTKKYYIWKFEIYFVIDGVFLDHDKYNDDFIYMLNLAEDDEAFFLYTREASYYRR